jgi:hypothetical protein
MSKKNTMRVKLVNAIIEYAGDEFEDSASLAKLAGMSEDELVDNLINILEYYHEQANQ